MFLLVYTFYAKANYVHASDMNLIHLSNKADARFVSEMLTNETNANQNDRKWATFNFFRCLVLSR